MTKFKKFIAISAAILSIELVSAPVVLNKPQLVNADVHHGYIWWSKKPRKVRVTRDHKIYEIQAVLPRYKSYEIRSKILKKGSTIKIVHGWSYLWLVYGHGLAHNYNKRFWVANGMHGWYRLAK